ERQIWSNAELITGSDDAVESVASLIPVDTNINQQLKTCKSFGTHYREAIHGPHASFRLRVLQEQRMQSNFMPKGSCKRQQKLDELKKDDLSKFKFGTYTIQNENETFGDANNNEKKLGLDKLINEFIYGKKTVTKAIGMIN
ncbi:hypothetical protein LOAG_10535, partial [Loa loa]